MKKILVEDPNKRITIEEALKHEWIIENTNNYLADWNKNIIDECIKIFK